MFRHGVSPYACHVQNFSAQGQAAVGASGALHFVCGGIFCRSAQKGRRFCDLQGLAEKRQHPAAEGKVHLPGAHGEGGRRIGGECHRAHPMGQGRRICLESRGQISFHERKPSEGILWAGVAEGKDSSPFYIFESGGLSSEGSSLYAACAAKDPEGIS